MANQKQLEVFLAGNPRATQTFTEKKITTKLSIFDVIFDVFAHVDNRERARESN